MPLGSFLASLLALCFALFRSRIALGHLSCSKTSISRNAFKRKEEHTFFSSRPPTRRPPIGTNRFREATFSFLNFGFVLESILAPFCLPKRFPFGTCSAQHRSTNRSEIGLLQKSLQDRTKMPPGPPRSPQDALPDPRGRPKTLSRRPPDAPTRVFRSTKTFLSGQCSF